MKHHTNYFTATDEEAKFVEKVLIDYFSNYMVKVYTDNGTSGRRAEIFHPEKLNRHDVDGLGWFINGLIKGHREGKSRGYDEGRGK